MKRFRKPTAIATCLEFHVDRQVQDEITLKGKFTALLCLSDQQPEKEKLLACVCILIEQQLIGILILQKCQFEVSDTGYGNKGPHHKLGHSKLYGLTIHTCINR